FMKNEIEENKLARQERNDLMDQERIPFDNWEINPQVTRFINIPSTPNNLYIYAGNSSDIFYDEIGRDHPDYESIMKLLTSANSMEWDDFEDKTVEYFHSRIQEVEWKDPFAALKMTDLFTEIGNSNTSPTELASRILTEIDNNWASVS